MSKCRTNTIPILKSASQSRKAWKLRLVRALYRSRLTEQQIVQLFQFIDCMMTLPDDLAIAFAQEVDAVEEETRVKFVTDIERRALARGEELGLAKGRRERDEAREEGRIAPLESIEGFLDVKFGALGTKLFPKARAIPTLAELRKFMRFLKKARTVAEVRGYFNSSTAS